MVYVVSISISILAFVIGVIVFRAFNQNKLTVSKRLSELGAAPETKKIKITKKKREKRTVSTVFANELSNAGIHMRSDEFLAIWVTCAALPPMVMGALGLHSISLFAAAAVGIALPIIFVKSRKKKRMFLFNHQLSDALTLMCNCMQTGMTFQQSMYSVATEIPDPIAKEFGRAVKEMQLGINIDDALDKMATRVKSEDLLLTVSAIQIQRQVGGSLAEILNTISITIKSRIKVKEEIRVMTATGRTSGLVIGAIPIVVCLILMLINPKYMTTFITDPIGNILLGVAVGMEALGFIVINKIVDVKY